MRLALALAVGLLVAACGGPRVHYPFQHAAYRIGDRSEMAVTIDGSVRVDEKESRDHRSSKRRSEIVAMQGDRVTAIRVEMLEMTSVLDGVPQPAVLGAFLVDMRSGRLEITKADGTAPTGHERAYVQAISAATFRPPPSSRERGYAVGEPVQLTSEDAMAFGLGSGATAELALSTVSDDEFVVQLTGSEMPTGTTGPAKLGKKWSGQIAISRHGPRTEHWRMEVEYTDGTAVVGHSHQELESRLILR